MGVQFSVFARKGGAIHGCIFFRDVEDQTGESYKFNLHEYMNLAIFALKCIFPQKLPFNHYLLFLIFNRLIYEQVSTF